MKVIELYNRLCEIIPTSLSCPWDKDGLESCPEPEREVKKVLISLDTTNEVIDKAVDEGADVIISHHPLFFGGLGNINALTFDGARAVKLAKHGIATMSFHTRLDALDGGVNDILAGLLGLSEVETVGDERIMRVGELEEETDAQKFAKLVKSRLSHGEGEREASVTLYPVGRKVKRVAVTGGSGGDEIALAAQNGADTYVTGDMKYHQLLSAADFNVNLITAGHFFTEYPVCFFLRETVRSLCPEAEIETVFSNRIFDI